MRGQTLDTAAAFPPAPPAAGWDCGNPPLLQPESPPAAPDIPTGLKERIAAAGRKPRQAVLRALLVELCALRPFTVAELCRLLERSDPKELRRNHLRPLREAGLLSLLYPETEKHPHQAYTTAKKQKEPDAG